jgi:hypothetical protein
VDLYQVAQSSERGEIKQSRETGCFNSLGIAQHRYPILRARYSRNRIRKKLETRAQPDPLFQVLDLQSKALDSHSYPLIHTMPSFLSKLTGSKSASKNPYENPHHPSHLPVPQKATSPPPPLRSVPPTISANLLAEARQVANRDPITGRALASTPDDTVAAWAQTTIVRAEQSAYMKRASQIQQTSGSRYDILSGREIRAREEAMWVTGKGEFYAPERMVGEFYGGGRSD